jgi:hypothetical protein
VRVLLLRDLTRDDAEMTLAAPVRVTLGAGLDIVVPAGTTTDFASIPPLLRGLVRRRGTDLAGLVHDHLYRTGLVRRQVADGIFYALCRDAGVSAGRSLALFLAVTLLGRRYYRRAADLRPAPLDDGHEP